MEEEKKWELKNKNFFIVRNKKNSLVTT